MSGVILATLPQEECRTMSDSVCAVVVTYNRKALLRECLGSLSRQSHLPDGVIVVDNGCTDGTSDMIRSEFSSVQVVVLPKNVGATGGYCEGIKSAYRQDFDWIWVMDDDAVPESRALESLLRALPAVPSNLGFMCSRVKGTDEQSMNVPSIDGRLGKNGYPQWDALLHLGIVKVATATMVSLLIHRRAIRSVGLPIREFFIWGDDTEFTTRITQSMPAYMVGASTVIHKRLLQAAPELDTETDVTRIQYFFFMYRNWLYILRKYNGRKSAASFFVRNGPRLFLRILRARTHRLLRIRTLITGLVAGLFFNPRVEYPEP